MSVMTRAEVERLVAEARKRGERPDLSGLDLRGANLRYTDLRGANLRYTDLRYTDLRGANLRYTDLRYTDLRGANLREIKLAGADLWRADLRHANLRGADPRYTDLTGVRGLPVLTVSGLPSGLANFVPTPAGWELCVGCWGYKTVEQPEKLISTNEGWPEAEDEECDLRRPGLEAVIDLCRAHMEYHSSAVDELRAFWNKPQEDQ